MPGRGPASKGTKGLHVVAHAMSRPTVTHHVTASVPHAAVHPVTAHPVAAVTMHTDGNDVLRDCLVRGRERRGGRRRHDAEAAHGGNRKDGE